MDHEATGATGNAGKAGVTEMTFPRHFPATDVPSLVPLRAAAYHLGIAAQVPGPALGSAISVPEANHG